MIVVINYNEKVKKITLYDKMKSTRILIGSHLRRHH